MSIDKRIYGLFKGAALTYFLGVESRLSALVQRPYAFGAYDAAASTNSTTDTDVSEATNLLITTTGGNILVITMGGGFHADDEDVEGVISILCDSTSQDVTIYTKNTVDGHGDDVVTSFAGMHLFTGINPGTHAVKLQWRSNAGSAIILDGFGQAAIFALELPR